nr:hypothetical protein [uncultured Roseateles sp.]
MKHDDELWLNAGVDGELDAPHSVELQARLRSDPAFKAAWEARSALSAAIRSQASYHLPPQALRDRLARQIAEPQAGTPVIAAPLPSRRWWLGAAGAAVAASLATGLGLRMRWGAPSTDDRLQHLAQQAVAGHARAMLVDGLIEVASSDQHTVRPWLSAKLGFATLVPELSAQGFELLGARRDLIDGQTVAVLVYRRRQHLVSVFVWPQTGEHATATRQERGFNVVQLAHGGAAYSLVSDLNARELGDLAELLRTHG